MTGQIGKYTRGHALKNNIWDEGQLGVLSGGCSRHIVKNGNLRTEGITK